MVLDSNPHLLNAKNSLLYIRLSRNCRILSFKLVSVPQSKAQFYDDTCLRSVYNTLNGNLSKVIINGTLKYAYTKNSILIFVDPCSQCKQSSYLRIVYGIAIYSVDTLK